MTAVSVVVPTRNRGELLVEAVRSALDANVADEVIVVDGGSDDGSVERAAELGDVRVIRGAFRNAAATRNAGWHAAAGEHVAFLDSDDRMLPEKVTCLQPLLAADGAVGLAHGATRVIDADGRPDPEATAERQRLVARARSVGTTYEALAERCVMYTSATLMRRAALEDVGGYDESIDTYEDLDLYLRLSERWRLVYADCVTAEYRIWPGNVDWRAAAEWTARIAQLHLGRPQDPRTRYALLRRIASSRYILLETAAARHAAVAAFRIDPLRACADRSVAQPLLCSFLPTRILARRREP